MKIELEDSSYGKKSPDFDDFSPSSSSLSFNAQNQQNILDTNDLAEVMKNLDQDITTEQGMTSIDFNTRLAAHQVSGFSGIETLAGMGVLPNDTLVLTRNIKRKSVSLLGQGRKEKVEITRNTREHTENVGGGRNLIEKMLGKNDNT